MNKQTQHIFSLSDAGDCMRQIPDNSIQLIIADPPYNINKTTWDKIKDYTNWAACGSGVTFNVCVRVGRNSIICDNDPQTVLYIKRQQERLQSFSYEFHDTL